METATISNGVPVIKNKIVTSRFLHQVIEKAGKNTRYSGTLEELTELVKQNIDNYTPGIGSKNGDVRLVHVPTENFFTGIVKITPENSHKLAVRYEPRIEGEAPVPQLYFPDEPYKPATSVKIVTYRADVLDTTDSRSSDAEWEIVAILADPAEHIPMNPATMARNSAALEGGTKRDYTPKEWTEAVIFWNEHAVIAAEPTA